MTSQFVERQADVRFGVYLRPSYAMSRALAEMHDLLRRHFGLVVAGVFMPHTTIKGFFRSDATVSEIVQAVTGALEDRAPFTVFNNGPVPFGRGGNGIDVQHGSTSEINAEMQALHEAVFASLLPLVHQDCTLTQRERANKQYFAKLTLVMADIPDFLFDEVLAFISEAEPIGPPRFTAERVHLFAFRSDDWTGAWWHSLRWTLLNSWRLEQPVPTESAMLNSEDALARH